MNDKLKEIKIDPNTLKPIAKVKPLIAYRGTEAGHYYTNLVETEEFIIGARDLNEDISPNWPLDGIETRIRVMLKGEVPDKSICFLESLAFTQKRHAGENEPHWSVVTEKASVILGCVKLYFELLED